MAAVTHPVDKASHFLNNGASPDSLETLFGDDGSFNICQNHFRYTYCVEIG